jgi:predicted phosphatase
MLTKPFVLKHTVKLKLQTADKEIKHIKLKPNDIIFLDDKTLRRK